MRKLLALLILLPSAAWAQQLCPVGQYNFNGQCLNNTAGVATISGQTGTGTSGKGGGITLQGGAPVSPSTATGDVVLFQDPSNAAVNLKCSQPTAGNTGTAVCTGNNVAISSSGGGSGPSTVSTLTLKNSALATDTKETQFFNATWAGSLATNICAESDAGVVSTTDCLQLLRGSGATFNGFQYFDTTGNSFSFSGNDLVINEPGKNPLVIVEDSSATSFTGFATFVDTGTNEVSAGEVCQGHSNVIGAQFVGGASVPACGLGTNGAIVNQGGTVVVPQTIGANGVAYMEGNGNTYTKIWVGPTPVTLLNGTYSAGVSSSSWGSNANASNVTNLLGGTAANTQANGTPIVTQTLIAPTISSGFGSTPSVPHANGPLSFEVNVGTGGTASSGVVGLPTAPNRWSCWVADTGTTPTGYTLVTASAASSITVTNYSRTTGSALAWTASEVLTLGCTQH